VGIVLGKMMDRFGANVIDWHGRVVINGGGSRSLVLVGPGWIRIYRGESPPLLHQLVETGNGPTDGRLLVFGATNRFGWDLE
jgi:hypothetical protein